MSISRFDAWIAWVNISDKILDLDLRTSIATPIEVNDQSIVAD